MSNEESRVEYRMQQTNHYNHLKDELLKYDKLQLVCRLLEEISDNDQLKIKNFNLESKHRQLKIQNNYLKTMLEQQMKKSNDKYQKLATAENNAKIYQEKYINLQSYMNGYMDELKKMEKDFREVCQKYNQESKKKEEEVQLLANRIQELTQKCYEYEFEKNNTDRNQQLTQQTYQQLQHLNNQIKRLSEQNAEYQQEYAISESVVDRQCQQIQEMKAVLEDRVLYIQQCQDNLKWLEQNVQESNRQIDRLNEIIKDNIKHESKWTNEIERLEKRNNELRVELERLAKVDKKMDINIKEENIELKNELLKRQMQYQTELQKKQNRIRQLMSLNSRVEQQNCKQSTVSKLYSSRQFRLTDFQSRLQRDRPILNDIRLNKNVSPQKQLRKIVQSFSSKILQFQSQAPKSISPIRK